MMRADRNALGPVQHHALAFFDRVIEEDGFADRAAAVRQVKFDITVGEGLRFFGKAGTDSAGARRRGSGGRRAEAARRSGGSGLIYRRSRPAWAKRLSADAAAADATRCRRTIRSSRGCKA